MDFAEISRKISRAFGILSMCAETSKRFFPEISEISERFRGISRQVYEISVSDGPLDWITRENNKPLFQGR